jgi:hypothetical protein
MEIEWVIVFLIGTFFLQHFECTIPLFFAARFFAEKAADSLTNIPLYVMSHFSLTAFKILSSRRLGSWALTLHFASAFHTGALMGQENVSSAALCRSTEEAMQVK